MFSYVFMKILESRPHRYDWGIDFLTSGQTGRIKDRIVTHFVRPGRLVGGFTNRPVSSTELND